jgi:hypothetical protein
MAASFSSGCLAINPPPLFLLNSATAKTAAASMSGGLFFGGEKGRMYRLVAVVRILVSEGILGLEF